MSQCRSHSGSGRGEEKMLYLSGGSHLEQDTHRSARRYLAELYSGVFQNPMPPLEKTAAGKPVLPGCFCSLTHTKRGTFCALSDRPVGVDAEDVSRRLSPALAKKILSPGELDQYSGAYLGSADAYAQASID